MKLREEASFRNLIDRILVNRSTKGAVAPTVANSSLWMGVAELVGLMGAIEAILSVMRVSTATIQA